MNINFRNIGLKMTPQRRAILEFLEGNKSHPSAEDIYRDLKKRFPGISMATVYNNLEVLKKKGYIRELNIDPERKRYDPDTRAHHHFICLSCKRVIDIYQEIDLPEPEVKGYEILGSSVEFYGLCSGCQESEEVQRQDTVLENL